MQKTKTFYASCALLLATIGAFFYFQSVRSENASMAAQLHALEVQKLQESNKQEELDNLKKDIRLQWDLYFTASDLQYKYSEWGGISALNFNFTNRTDFLLDEVKIKVDYIKANGDLYTSEIVTINSLPARVKKNCTAPSKNRGTSVKTTILSITSRELNFCYREYEMRPFENDDRFLCNK